MNTDRQIYVTRSSLPPFEEYCEEIKDLWSNHILTNMGEKHNKLQDALREYLKVPFIELFTNGHMALELTIQAFDFPKGSEVITTPFTFASTTHAIVRNGLVPVFCDINEKDYTIDVSKIEGLITKKTVAILPVHVYGNICDVYSIDIIAKKYGLKVIYDAAHAFGESYDNVAVGQFGDASIFSFHATKVYNTIEGGACCYRDPIIGERLYQLKNFGIKGPESVMGVGANAKMNEFCAAMGLCNLRHIEEEIGKRKQVYEQYTKLFMKNAETKGWITQPDDRVIYNYAYYPIRVVTSDGRVGRDDIFKALYAKGINARKYFYPLTSDFECYSNQFSGFATPVARTVSESILTLPIYPDLRQEMIEEIQGIIEIILKSGK